MGATSCESFEDSVPKALNADVIWLWRYDQRDWRHRLLRVAQQIKFEATLTPRLDKEIERVNKVIDLENERLKRQPKIGRAHV